MCSLKLWLRHHHPLRDGESENKKKRDRTMVTWTTLDDGKMYRNQFDIDCSAAVLTLYSICHCTVSVDVVFQTFRIFPIQFFGSRLDRFFNF